MNEIFTSIIISIITSLVSYLFAVSKSKSEFRHEMDKMKQEYEYKLAIVGLELAAKNPEKFKKLIEMTNNIPERKK